MLQVRVFYFDYVDDKDGLVRSATASCCIAPALAASQCLSPHCRSAKDTGSGIMSKMHTQLKFLSVGAAAAREISLLSGLPVDEHGRPAAHFHTIAQHGMA